MFLSVLFKLVSEPLLLQLVGTMARKVSEVDADFLKFRRDSEERAATVETRFDQLEAAISQGQENMKEAMREAMRQGQEDSAKQYQALFALITTQNNTRGKLQVTGEIPGVSIPPPKVTISTGPETEGLESAWDYSKWGERRQTSPTLQSGLRFGVFEPGNTSGSGLFHDTHIGQDSNWVGDRPMHQVDYRLRKLKMPLFDGSDAFWVGV